MRLDSPLGGQVPPQGTLPAAVCRFALSFRLHRSDAMRLDSATKCCTTFPALNSAQTEKSFPRSFSSYHVLCSKLILSPQTHHGRYAVGVNVIVSFYSIAQAFVETRRLISPWLWSTSCYCISLVLDQASLASTFYQRNSRAPWLIGLVECAS